MDPLLRGVLQSTVAIEAVEIVSEMRTAMTRTLSRAKQISCLAMKCTIVSHCSYQCLEGTHIRGYIGLTACAFVLKNDWYVTVKNILYQMLTANKMNALKITPATTVFKITMCVS